MSDSHGPIRVLIVVDAQALRWRLRDLVEESSRIAVVAEAASAAGALTTFKKQRPDVVILDLELHDGAVAFSLLRTMKRKRPGCGVVVLTSHPDAAYEKRCRELGADFFFDKFQQMDRVPEVLLDLNRE